MVATPLFILILLAVALLANIMLVFWMFRTEKRLKRFFQGKKAINLEESFQILGERINTLEDIVKNVQASLGQHDFRLKHAVKSVPLSRFNPFPDVGGNQSFAMTLVDEEGNGVILSSLYARDRMSVFAKGVKAGKGEQELSVEEQKILDVGLK